VIDKWLVKLVLRPWWRLTRAQTLIIPGARRRLEEVFGGKETSAVW